SAWRRRRHGVCHVAPLNKATAVTAAATLHQNIRIQYCVRSVIDPPDPPDPPDQPALFMASNAASAIRRRDRACRHPLFRLGRLTRRRRVPDQSLEVRAGPLSVTEPAPSFGEAEQQLAFRM